MTIPIYGLVKIDESVGSSFYELASLVVTSPTWTPDLLSTAIWHCSLDT